MDLRQQESLDVVNVLSGRYGGGLGSCNRRFDVECSSLQCLEFARVEVFAAVALGSLDT